MKSDDGVYSVGGSSDGREGGAEPVHDNPTERILLDFSYSTSSSYFSCS